MKLNVIRMRYEPDYTPVRRYREIGITYPSSVCEEKVWVTMCFRLAEVLTRQLARRHGWNCSWLTHPEFHAVHRRTRDL